MRGVAYAIKRSKSCLLHYNNTLCLESRHRYPRFSVWRIGSVLYSYRSQPPKGAGIYSYYNTERKTASEASSGGLGSDNWLVTRGLGFGYGW